MPIARFTKHARKTYFYYHCPLAFFLLLSSGYGKAAQRYTAAVAVPAAAAAKPGAAEPVAPPPPVVIPLGDIATRATEVSNVLGNLTASAAPSAQIETIGQTLPDLSEKLDVEFAITTKTLEAEPTLDVLQSLQQDWQRHELAAKRSLSALTLKAAKLQQSLNQLTDLQKNLGQHSRVGAASQGSGSDPATDRRHAGGDYGGAG